MAKHRMISNVGEVDIPVSTGKQMIKDDRIFDVPVFSKVCNFCINKDEGLTNTCRAFPNGIPMKIWMSENDHKKPVEGDMGITFKRRVE
jgi:hypothetical protein